MTATATETPPASGTTTTTTADPATPAGSAASGTPAAAAGTPAAGTPATPVAGDPAAPAAAATDDKNKTAAGSPPAVPDKYDLKVPAESKVDKAVVERTVAIARELGLSQDNAQKTLEFVSQEVASQLKATLDAHAFGGDAWKAQDQEWRTAALADKEIGGTPEKLTASVEVAKKVIAKFGDERAVEFLEKSGLGSHPAALSLLVRIGRAMSENGLVRGDTPSGPPAKTEAAVAARIYDNPTSKPKS